MFLTFSLLPLLVVPIFEYFYSTSKWLYLYGLVLVLISLLLFSSKKIKIPLIDGKRLFLIGFLVLFFIGNILSNGPLYIRPILINLLLGGLIAFFSFNSFLERENNTLKKVSKANSIGCFFVLLICSFQHFNIPGPEKIGLLPGQLGATFGNPNFLAEYLGLSIIIQIFSLDFVSSKVERRFKITLLMLSFIVFYMTFCRSAFLALKLSLIITYFYLLKKYWKKCLVIFSVLFILFLSFYSLSPRKTFPSKSGSNKARFIRYVNSLYMIADRPFLGFGPDRFISEYLPYKSKYKKDPEVLGNTLERHLHSTYLETAVEFGPIFLILLLLLFFGFFKKIWQRKVVDQREESIRKLLITLFLFISIEITFSFALKRPTIYFICWFFCGIGLAFLRPNTIELGRKFRIAFLPFLYFFFDFGYKRGISHYNYFKYPQYIGSMEEACKLWPYDVRFCIRKGELELIQRDYSGARETFHKILKFFPNLYPALGPLGHVYLMEGKLEKGCFYLKSYKTLVKVKTRHDRIYRVHCE